MKHLRRLVRRVEIGANEIAVRLNADVAREQIRTDKNPAVIAGDTDLDVLIRRLAQGASLAHERDDLVLTIPVRAKFCGGQHHIVTADRSGDLQQFPRPDRALVKAVVRAHSWLSMLLDGSVSSVEALAKVVRQDRGYVRRVLRLAFLGSALTSALLEGRQPDHVSLTDLLEADIPHSWREQARLFEL